MLPRTILLELQHARLVDPGAETTDFGYNAAGKLGRIRDSLAFEAVTGGLRTADDTTVTVIDHGTCDRVVAATAPASIVGVARAAHRHSYTSGATYTVDGVTTVQAGLNPAIGYASRVTFNNRMQATSTAAAAGRVVHVVQPHGPFGNARPT